MKDHGTRTRYVGGCRCDLCRQANRRYAAERGRRAKELAALVPQPTKTAQRMWHSGKKGGKRGELEHRLVTFKRICLGVNGMRCERGTYLKKNSAGDICSYCREHLLTSYQMVPAVEARKALEAIQKEFRMGLREVAQCTGLNRKTLQALLHGREICDRSTETVLRSHLKLERAFDTSSPEVRKTRLLRQLPNFIPRLKELFPDNYTGVAGDRMLYRDLKTVGAALDEDGRWGLHDSGVGKKVGHREPRDGSQLPVL
jgi:hypothetical protein